jgi:hypothetical protein
MKKNTVGIAMIALFTLLLALPAMAVDFSGLADKPGNHGKGGGGKGGGGNGGGGNGGGGNGGGGNGGGNCGTCAGVITEMTLRYNGTITGAQIMVIQKERSQNHVLFEGTVQPGGTIQIEGANKNGNLSPVLHIFVNGRLNTPIPTSCAGLVAEGLKRGDFEVMQATSSEGGKICNDDDDDGEEGEEDACCDGQVDSLTLRYTGTETVAVKVTQKIGSRQVTIFSDDQVATGDQISFDGQNNRGTFGSQIQIFVDGQLQTRIHTSCSEPIGPGLVRGDFEVVSGTSRNGGALCPIEDNGEGEPSTCSACDGQVNELTLRYIGTVEDATIRVTQKNGKDKSVEVFKGTVAPGTTFTIEGENKKGTFGSEIRVYVNGELDATIHTSCSEPIGPGLVEGDFEVVEGFSREGGRLCEVETD